MASPSVSATLKRTQYRPEIQMKVELRVSHVDSAFIHFPRKKLARPKQFASADERQGFESSGSAIDLDFHLVCATAVEKPDGLDQAFRRAAYKEQTPQRPAEVAIDELDEADPAHPKNGGAIVICQACKKRERKRNDRSEKKSEYEQEWSGYNNDRTIIIHEEEYKEWKDIKSKDQHLSPKEVEFAMRIACYCSHQGDNSGKGFRVIFTLKDAQGSVLAQQLSEVFHIRSIQKDEKDKRKDKKAKDDYNEEILSPSTTPPAIMPQNLRTTMPDQEYFDDRTQNFINGNEIYKYGESSYIPAYPISHDTFFSLPTMPRRTEDESPLDFNMDDYLSIDGNVCSPVYGCSGV